MKKLVILDYTSGTVHIYNISSTLNIDDEFIERLGFRTTQCNWMSGDLEIVQHKGIIE